MNRLEETPLAAAVEAVFALEQDDAHWLHGVLCALTELSGPEHQSLGFFYDAREEHEPKLWNVCGTDPARELESALQQLAASLAPSELGAALRRQESTDSTAVGPLQAGFARHDWATRFTINSLDPAGLGCLVWVGHRQGASARPLTELVPYQRLAGNLATAFRCRHRLAVSSRAADATDRASRAGGHDPASHNSLNVAAPSTRLAQQRLRIAVGSDTPRHEKQPAGAWQKALSVLQPTLGVRLTLVDTFEEHGSHYVVAREGDPCPQGIDTLTDRERQIVEFATLGNTNKEIAHALGISDATVRVLMARAARRVGVHTRRELLAHPAVIARRPAAAQ